MVRFNELRITPDGNFLIIDASIEEGTRYEGMSISNVIIDNLDTFIENGPSDNPVYSMLETSNILVPDYNKVYNQNNDLIYTETKELCYVDEPRLVRSIHLRLKTSDFKDIDSLQSSIFFVYVIILTESECGTDTFKVMRAIVGMYPLYNNIMNYIRLIDDECNIPKGLIDSILRVQCIDTAIKSGEYITAIKYWKKFSTDISENVITQKPCGCYG